ncbi:host-nuclease inhibitor Gam family protein [Rodentibacter sp. Ppn85]|uniref:host-nuclease inhibitor Gam family protein n=1 Tax=Rodentibacter sp. Ppn85 TaxID=1908525 RepID=UPI000986E80A|nr:host-nuclease inhibitor Gam family protein [Rodentibacter sp. Ppn85]OOF65156.1 host-nuclease inhibitor protein Gam [Rodentibacter sp. Ppn85]
MAKRATRIKTDAQVYVPQTREDVASDIKTIGDLNREITRLETEMNDAIAKITEDYKDKFTPLQERIKHLSNGVQFWSEANRDQITNGGKTKTANLVTGEVSWRVRTPSVKITGVDSVLQNLRIHGLDRFIRIKEEINKEAILNEKSAVIGIAGIKVITGVEDFVITPFEQDAAY